MYIYIVAQPFSNQRIKDDVTISPNGIVFVKPTVRRGILPRLGEQGNRSHDRSHDIDGCRNHRMLEEILGTRIMVKQSMKLHKQKKVS